MQKILGVIRLLGMALIIIVCLVPIIIGVVVFKKNLMWTLKRRQSVARMLSWWLNTRIHVSGVPQDGNFLFIGNHRSYADPVIAACSVAFMPVAMAEVSNWPIIGFGAKVTGIVYVKRESKDSRADTRLAIRQALKDGSPVLIYPEGGTTDGLQTRPFRVGTFNIAAEEGIAVVPITIEYGDKGDVWVGADTFIPHFIRCFGKWRTDAFIHFSEPILEMDGEVLMKKTQAAIDGQLIDFQRFI